MRSFLSIGLTMTTLLVGVASQIAAQSLAEPGQLAQFATASNAIVESATHFSMNSTTDLQEQRHDRIINRIWLGSLCAMLAATGMDAATSVGKYEGNAALASSNGTFGARGISIKAGIAGGTILAEVLLRKHKDLRTTFVIGNFTQAALFSAVAVHNMGIASAK